VWLKEVVNNLIENSTKYTMTGQIIVGLEKTGDLPAQAGKVLFSVKDTGVGITDEDKKNLFTEGGRGKDSIKVNVDSTGYGLFTVKLVVEAHKGRVWAESEGAGKGSQFYVELPLSA
jgi:signal transduction histidine kinase